MSKTAMVAVKGLSLDLKNFRTVPQKSEPTALRAMIAISPDWFWALMGSLLEEGYHPTENIIVQKDGAKLLVREGNRRIAALKLAHGFLRRTGLTLPSNIEDGLSRIDAQWKKQNLEVPCAIFDESEQAQVERIVNLTHGKGDRAGRDKWGAVAKARYNRDVNQASEPPLDLLEAYLRGARNLTPQQAERWSGEYPLTVLEEALKRTAQRLDYPSSRALADAYPKAAKHKSALDKLLHDVGIGAVTFQMIRDGASDFLSERYGVQPPRSSQSKGSQSGGSQSGASSSSGGASTGGSAAAKRSGPAAVSVSDPRSVQRLLRAFVPRGRKREKLVTLLGELRKLRPGTPHAFCFVLRSMFEVSAKAYCDDHAAAGLSYVKSGVDRALVEVLRDVARHLTNNNVNKEMAKKIHGAMVSLANSHSILSVTSMNQLVHNPRFSIGESDIPAMFNNIFPLLEEMNR